MSFRTTVTFTWARPLVNEMLGALTTVPGAALLTTPKVILLKTGPIPTPDSGIADYVVADFSGYAAATATFSTAVNMERDIQGKLATVTFVATVVDPFVECNVIGYALTDGSGEWYGGELFAEVVPFAVPGDFLQLDVVLPVPCYGSL